MSEYSPDLLPPQPQIIPDELARFTVDNRSEWTTRVPPQAVGMFIAAVVQWLSQPRFGTKVVADTHSDGWTIRVQLQTPSIREDITVGDINQ